PPFAFFRHKPKKNPFVPLPDNAEQLLNKVTHALITHLHPDHLDAKGYAFLKGRNIPVIGSKQDEKKLRKKGLNVVLTINYDEPIEFLEGKLIGIPAKHGYGFIAKLMGHVMGFYLELENEPSIYISSDTIYTKDVDRTLRNLNPNLTVLAAGSAQFDLGGPLLMNIQDIRRFISLSPGKVYANHLEAVNHCPTTRAKLKKEVAELGLGDKVIIPQDGDSFEVN
ncbi:MBL fold metallo-hydrolase, partial [Prolixibacteraceae bacterium]|nr:MBL fold metallo-hydrolase [Prolixibacteraceae bacterium]